MLQRNRAPFPLIFGVSLAGLMVEILLTRIFEFQLWYHFVGLAVSIPFLGFGAAGSYLSLPGAVKRKAGRSEQDRAGFFTRTSILFALSLVGCFWIATGLQVDVEKILQPLQVALFVLYVFLFTIPFFFAGLIVCEILAGGGAAVGKLYAADLIGASLGSISALVLLRPLGAPALVMALAVLVLCFTLPMARASKKRDRIFLWAAMGFIVVVGAALGSWTPFDIHPAPSKAMPSMLGPNRPEYTRWDILYRVDVSPEGSGYVEFGGGPSDRFMHLRLVGKPVFQDGILLTWLIRKGYKENEQWPLHLLQAVPYQVKQNPEKVAIIGVGGGPDVWIGKRHGAKGMVGVEINPVVTSLLTDVYADYTGRLAEQGDFELHAAEGRHFMSRRQDRFDLIQLTAVDTVTAAFRGSNAMVESYLYTVEAVEELAARLNENGVLSYTRWMFKPPRESLRLFHTMLEVLRRQGVSRPWQHLLVVAKYTPPISWADVMMKKSPFTPSELQRVRQWCEAEGFRMIYVPGDGPGESVFSALARHENPRAFASTYMLNIQPPTDDSPFFFNFHKPFSRNPEGEPIAWPLGYTVSVVNLIVVGCMALAFVLAPLLPLRSELKSIRKKGSFLLYFSGIGLGFILFELAVIQRFIVLVGGPARALAVVLFSILLFSGLGARYSQRIDPKNATTFRRTLYGVVMVLLLETVLLKFGLTNLLLSASDGVRIAAIVLFLFPAGFMMGMPFPLALRRLSGSTAAPWAWGINACFTIVGSSAATLIASFLGFSTVMVLSVGAYLAAAVAAPRIADS